ncbi:ComF family protein [Patescibacteria group bacterium]|nr:ComF family protein [Patescibacteria group bacterium]MBU1727772.1 ComF family protein [Patescibacteria group bacterium]
MKVLNAILDLIFPPKCISCGKSNTDFCLKCFSKCPQAERESAEWIFPLYDYRYPPIKKAMWLLKYKGKRRIADLFAEIMYERIIEELSDLKLMENFCKPILIPIPLAPRRMRERGFNQAELICQKLIKLDNKKNFEFKNNVLLKPKDTEHQALIKDRQKRLKNLVGSFVIKNAQFIKNRNIILIDDISTTGATFSEARKTLKEAGTKKIIAFAIAH